MAKSDCQRQNQDAGLSAEVTGDRAADRGDEPPLDILSHTASPSFKARVRAYAFSPPNNDNQAGKKMSSSDGAPAAQNPRKRRSESSGPTAASTKPKRGALSASTSSTAARPAAARRRSQVRKARRAQDGSAAGSNLVDSVRPGLMLLMIGLNTGLMTGA